MPNNSGRSAEFEKGLKSLQERRSELALDAPKAAADYKRTAEETLRRMAWLRAERLKRAAENKH
jgi:hypothetical protein